MAALFARASDIRWGAVMHFQAPEIELRNEGKIGGKKGGGGERRDGPADRTSDGAILRRKKGNERKS